MKPTVPALAVFVLSLMLIVGTFWHTTALMVVGAILACATSCVVTVEYLLLVPMRRNPGAKRLVGLLVAVDLLLLSSIARFFFHDYALRNELLTVMFWALFASLAYLGRHIWRDQIAGARRHRAASGPRPHVTETEKEIH